MKKLSGLIGALFVLAALSSLALAQSVAGEWDAQMETPGQPSVAKVIFKQDGEKLTGTVKRASGDSTLQGTLKGKEVKFVYSINYNGNDLPIAIVGTLEGDTIKGTADIANGGFQGGWIAKRAGGGSTASIAPVGAPAMSINVSGDWDGTVETGQGSGNPSFMLKQEGEKLTGRYKGMLGESELSGTVKGEQIQFSFKVSGQLEGTVTYEGTTDGKTMKGKVNLAGLGEGTFTAKKK